jgi:sulfite reductase alpha subunit-like flavoprotein
MFLSTYGTGDSPSDGEDFLAWLQSLKGDKILSKLSFIIMALGNSTFEYFCGHGRKVT